MDSHTIATLRQELIDFAALIELELDFGEEDVEFADRGKLRALVIEIQKVIAGSYPVFFYLGKCDEKQGSYPPSWAGQCG